MKLCIDCKYHKQLAAVPHACLHPELAHPVTGRPVLCADMRRTDLAATRPLCLFEGTLWEGVERTVAITN